MEDHRLTIWEVADEVGISRGSANTILTEDLGMQRVATKFVPKLLSPEQQQLRLEVAQDMLECANRDPEFLKTVITGDESWVYGYDLDSRGGPRVVIWNICVVLNCFHGGHPVAAPSTGAFHDHKMTLPPIGPWNTHALLPKGPAPHL